MSGSMFPIVFWWYGVWILMKVVFHLKDDSKMKCYKFVINLCFDFVKKSVLNCCFIFLLNLGMFILRILKGNGKKCNDTMLSFFR